MYKVVCVIAGLFMLMPLWVLAQARSQVDAGDLASMRGRFRPLLIFHADAQGQPSSDASVREQLAWIDAHQAELKARDVVVVPIPTKNGYAAFSPQEERSLQERFHVESGKFTIVLVGKDGGEKLRSHAPVTIGKLDALIDAMPMRQQEVRDGHSK
jgi:hypothetical protein